MRMIVHLIKKHFLIPRHINDLIRSELLFCRRFGRWKLSYQDKQNHIFIRLFHRTKTTLDRSYHNFNTKENDMIIVIDYVCTNPFDKINLESSHCYVVQINICAWRTNQWMIHFRTDQSVNVCWWWWTTTTHSKLSRQYLFLSSIEEHSFTQHFPHSYSLISHFQSSPQPITILDDCCCWST